MKPIPSPDLRRMNSRELAALQNEVLKGVAIAAENRRRGEALLDEVIRARTEKRIAARRS